MSMSFVDKLLKASRANDSLVCVGLDPDPDLMPIADVVAFNKAIIEATRDLVCAYKPNLAFYEALGLDGMRIAYETRKAIPDSIPVIGDAKRGDIGNTARAYAKALFDVLGFDAATVNPYGGYDALEPFLAYADRGIMIWCRSSNAGSADFQSLTTPSSLPLYEVVAQKAREWNRSGNVGLVMGATFPQELKRVREMCPDMPILIPGLGAQAGDVEASVKFGIDAKGEKAIFNSSRQILYASKGMDFAQAARRAAQRLRDEINKVRWGR